MEGGVDDKVNVEKYRSIDEISSALEGGRGEQIHSGCSGGWGVCGSGSREAETLALNISRFGR